MSLQSINYDLVKPGRNYDSLIRAIKDLSGSWCHPVESSWIVSTSLTSKQVRDRLVPHIDSNDKLLVAELTGVAAWHNLDPKVAEWLQGTRV